MLGQLDLFGKSKIDVAIERLKAFEPADGYYVGASGGKDSDVIIHLARLAEVKHELHHQHTTADAPETVRYIRKYYPETEIDYPDKNIWQLIVANGVPPTRLMRYCCRELKEYGGDGRTKVLGVRWQESSGRKNNRKMTEQCYKNSTFTVNPIIDWSEAEVWEMHQMFNLPHNPLYDQGCKRCGCIMCPQKGKKGILEDAKRWPRYYNLYIKAFEKMLITRKEKGLETTWKTGQEVFEWWIQL